MAEKVTVMVLKVDLQCPCCYKKVKKILCKFPLDNNFYHGKEAKLNIYFGDVKIFWTREIRNQVYDEKANTVTITVVCCNPEKIRDKLCCKGCKVIKSIEIKEPPKPKPEPKPKPKPEAPKKAEDPPKPPGLEPPPSPSPLRPAPPPPVPVTGPKIVPGCPPNYLIPMRTCCGPCYEGYGGGPCCHGYGVPPPPQLCYGGYCACRCGQRGWGCYVSKCDYYFSEDNPRGCSII